MGPREHEAFCLSHLSGGLGPLLTGAAQAFCFLNTQEKFACIVLPVEDEATLGEFNSCSFLVDVNTCA